MDDINEITKKIKHIKTEIHKAEQKRAELEFKLLSIENFNGVRVLITYLCVSCLLTIWIIESGSGDYQFSIWDLRLIVTAPFEILIGAFKGLGNGFLNFIGVLIIIIPILLGSFYLGGGILYLIISIPSQIKKKKLKKQIDIEKEKIKELNATILPLEETLNKALKSQNTDAFISVAKQKATKIIDSQLVKEFALIYSEKYIMNIMCSARENDIRLIQVNFELSVSETNIQGYIIKSEQRRSEITTESFIKHRMGKLNTAIDRAAFGLAVAFNIRENVKEHITEDPSGSAYKLNFNLKDNSAYGGSDWEYVSADALVTLSYSAPNANFIPEHSIFFNFE